MRANIELRALAEVGWTTALGVETPSAPRQVGSPSQKLYPQSIPCVLGAVLLQRGAADTFLTVTDAAIMHQAGLNALAHLPTTSYSTGIGLLVGQQARRADHSTHTAAQQASNKRVCAGRAISAIVVNR